MLIFMKVRPGLNSMRDRTSLKDGINGKSLWFTMKDTLVSNVFKALYF